MNRTRAAGHTLTLATLGLLACAIWLCTISLWYAAFGFVGTWTTAALASGCHLAAHRERWIARQAEQQDAEPEPTPDPCCALWIATDHKVHSATCSWPRWARTSLTEEQEQEWEDLASQLRKDQTA